MWYPGSGLGSARFRVVRAVGNGDQRIFIVPEHRTVVTVFAGNYDNFRYMSGERVFARVIDARRE